MKCNFYYCQFFNIFRLTAIGGRRLQTTPPEHIAEGTTMSTLTIKNAQDSDSGTYTCEPSQLETAHVNLHVLECKFSGFIPHLSYNFRKGHISEKESHE